MNFSPETKAWIMLISLVVGTGGAVGLTAYSGGASAIYSVACATVTGMANLYHALNSSPMDKAEPKP